jgi:hypothetical protein
MTTTLDLAARAVPLRPAVTVTALVEHHALPAILAAALPGVTHSHQSLGAQRDEHVFVDEASGDAVRAVLTIDHATGTTSTEIGEVGEHQLWDRLIVRCTEWQMAGGQIPASWTA